jgi:hypothetical protein
MTTASPIPLPSATKLGPGDLVTDTVAAAILGCAVQTLRNYRWRGLPPIFRKIGKRMVRYHVADLAAFIGDDKADAV